MISGLCRGEPGRAEFQSFELRGCNKKVHSRFHRDGVAEQQDTVASFLQMLFFAASESIGAYKLCATVALSTSFNLLHYKKIQLIWGICYMIFHLPDFIIFLVSVSSGHQTEVSPALFLPTFLHSSLSFYYYFFSMYFYIFFFPITKIFLFSPSFACDDTHSKGYSIFSVFKKTFPLCSALSLLVCHREGKY